jgi:hypothetical protein
MIEVLKQALEALECALSEDKPYIDECKQAIQAGKQAIAELESQETVALEALVMICVKCRSNEWGPDTPRKQILNWFHDTASKALEDAQIFRGQA